MECWPVAEPPLKVRFCPDKLNYNPRRNLIMTDSESGLNDQIYELFIIFSRLEYALTRTDGFARGNEGNPAAGDWFKFAQELGRDFFDHQKANANNKILWENPPGQWIMAQGEAGALRPEWKPRTAPLELRHSLEPVNWVRNCVIHGESQDKVPRYLNLVSAAVSVLDAAVDECRQRDEDSKLREIERRFSSARMQET